MPHPARALALAIAALLVFSAAAPAEAAKKKTSRPAAAQTRAAAKPKAKPRARPAAPPARQPLVRQQTKAAQLNRIYDEYWDAAMRLNPLQATFQGDARHNDQLPNILSAAYRQQSHDFSVEWLGKVEKIGPDGLTGQDLLSYEIFVRDARMSLAAEQYPGWMLPVSQYYNLGSIMAILGSGSGAQPFNTVQDYDTWSRRSLGIPPLFDQAIANMRQGMAAGVVQPRDLMEKVLPQLDAVIKPTAEESIFWAPVRNLPDDFSAADKARIAAEYKRMIEYRIMPAYRALRGFIATEYLPATRASDGLSALPNGQAWYAQNIVQSTASTLTPVQIHALAEQRVSALQAQIATIMKDNRIRGSQQKMLRNMRTDRDFQYANADALLARYKQLQGQVNARLPGLLGTLPKAPMEIRAVEAERAATAAAVSYQPPLPDGMRPGILYVNTGELPSRRRWAAPMQYLHEGIPGHHVQLGLQQELDKLPRFRRLGGDIAFVEGWGLYAESLGEELGVYQDPYERIAYLQGALTRAARMAADTGVHAQGWSKRQAVDYLVKTADLPVDDATAEVERFMALPGQTLANGLGELKMMELRETAKAALGPRFDLRRFHEEILRDGSMPLDILDAKIARWIASEQAGGSASPTP
ncbi:MAG TPA: DUF885 domain-containing protein [Stenotrophomonas sp.]|jgi:uncharacterized protein (DUF885 family)|uniref:DUF885 domain-containing protein n=1 Tax=Stenotrophomonas TaxID=40323 RepID=UPI0002FE694E|nr:MULTISPECIES: DUF885 family protein [Stenotrophomonas]QIO89019.1 hypothetical protein G9274_002704 [Stenotrophomonas rhizophila]HBS62778.1 DUF885 domain-containing protein [Stenotrophomonas sp.]